MGATNNSNSTSRQSRYNGWSWPPHPFQPIAWGCLCYLSIFYFSTIEPGLLQPGRIAGYTVMGLLLVIHFVVHILACTVNPADPNVIRKMDGKRRQDMPTFDRTKHKHVIENQHCYLCDVNVADKSKHCSACNKCVSNFDHHCKWLNNCVGDRNYRLFIATLVTAIAGAIIIVSLCLMQFVAYFTDRNSGSILQQYRDALALPTSSTGNVTVMSTPPPVTITTAANYSGKASPVPTAQKPVFRVLWVVVSDRLWLAMVMLTALLALTGMGLLGHLLGFHVYLMYRGISTYEYVVQLREKAEKEAREKQMEDGKIELANSKSSKGNKIVPQGDEYELDSGRPVSSPDHHELSTYGNQPTTPTPTPPLPNTDSESSPQLGKGTRKQNGGMLSPQRHGYGDMPPLAPPRDGPGPGGGDVVKKRKKRRKKRRMHASDVQLNPSILHDMSTLGDVTFQQHGYPSCVTVSASVIPPPFTAVHGDPLTGSLRTLPVGPGVYTSDSAESLQEIPVAHTHHGSLHQPQPQPDAGTYPRIRTPRRRSQKYEKSRARAGVGEDGGQSYKHRRRRKDVPPLDLSGSSSEEEWQRRRAKMPLSHV